MAIDTRSTPAPVETVTPIRPSEAIRLGCLVLPVQEFGSAGDGRQTGCVHAAAISGGNVFLSNVWTDTFGDGPLPACPEPDCRRDGHALHLNDDHRWSRERIADWLEGLGL